MLNAASLSVRPLPGDFLPEDDESAAKPLRVEIGKATEDSGKNHPAVVVPRLPAGFTLPAPSKFLATLFVMWTYAPVSEGACPKID
ncbi:uncharacterized protein LOC110621203 isoform X3 [Manihot esculenta]|uniref:uncharacterized protein LOC110621203 isoform X3 n=1 Tax=Manihot esculenta TaxID=3983 RepID=UPI000B5D834B|nr:uncharacterized protein LOC110621203 isoform X3 [Manihot esculenta]